MDSHALHVKTAILPLLIGLLSQDEYFVLIQNLVPGFDVREISEEGTDDWEGLDASAAHIANLLSTEPADGTLDLEPKYICVCVCGTIDLV